MPFDAYGHDIGDPLLDWQPRPLPPREPMSGRFCRLEPLDVAVHAAALFEAYVAAQAASRDPSHFAVLDLASDRAVGTAALMRIDPGNGVIEVGHITFSPRLKRTPGGTEAIFLLMRRVFDELGYRRFEWKCDSLNAPSRRAALRYGFLYEGTSARPSSPRAAIATPHGAR